nr:MAG TPA: hypothetical protein [Caudoviricetes sp.]DAG43263.1 MAG TPA: hypothetical protein [Bacteriophage sp.]
MRNPLTFFLSYQSFYVCIYCFQPMQVVAHLKKCHNHFPVIFFFVHANPSNHSARSSDSIIIEHTFCFVYINISLNL